MARDVQKDPWYVAGLAFECQGCGGCCAGPTEGYVWVTDDEIEDLADCLALPAAEIRRRCVRRVHGRVTIVEDPESHDCLFLGPAGLDGRRCRVYSARPSQCRAWPFWAANLRSPDAWAAASDRCPGINRGRLYTVAEIQSRMGTSRV